MQLMLQQRKLESCFYIAPLLIYIYTESFVAVKNFNWDVVKTKCFNVCHIVTGPPSYGADMSSWTLEHRG